MNYVFSVNNEKFTDDSEYILDIAKAKGLKEIKVGEAIQQKHSDIVGISNVDTLIESIQDTAYDNFDCFSIGYLDDITTKDKEKLKETVSSFLNKNSRQPDFFTVTNIKKINISNISSYINPKLEVIFAKYYFENILLILKQNDKIFLCYIAPRDISTSVEKKIIYPSYFIKSFVGPNLSDDFHSSSYGEIPNFELKEKEFVPYGVSSTHLLHPNFKILNNKIEDLMKDVKITGTNEKFKSFEESKKYIDETKEEMVAIANQYEGLLSLEDLCL